MKITLATSCFLMGALLAPVAGYTADSDLDRPHPLTFVKDSAITAKIKANLADEKLSSLTHIHVDTDSQGYVVLSGRARTQKEADKAVSIASEIEGVNSVKNNIQTGNAQAATSDSDRKHPMTFVKDSAITTKIKAKLADEKMSSLVHISVDTNSKGAVVLRGNTSTREEADKAVAIARATEGVTSVNSYIKVKTSS